ncbi:MAG TPA: hypothetical protein VNB64_01435, partial [Solirubrobacteraceae bacterium]|nr:hypothetical protein [Solirubrobacteraceae bacterium]
MQTVPLHDSIESLDYWRRRRARLPWHRRAARREAARMAVRWERRVRAALRQPDAPPSVRFAAARLVASCTLTRWARRAGAAVLVTAAVSGVAAGATLVLILQA